MVLLCCSWGGDPFPLEMKRRTSCEQRQRRRLSEFICCSLNARERKPLCAVSPLCSAMAGACEVRAVKSVAKRQSSSSAVFLPPESMRMRQAPEHAPADTTVVARVPCPDVRAPRHQKALLLSAARWRTQGIPSCLQNSLASATRKTPTNKRRQDRPPFLIEEKCQYSTPVPE